MSIITKSTAAYLAAAVAGLALSVSAVAEEKTYGFGAPIEEGELDHFVSPLPDGRGLPEGSGTVMQGKEIYTQHCMACHGVDLEGGIGDRLIGGTGSLVRGDGDWKPVKTVESYWPYATTLFDYVKRTMPFLQPGSLSNDEVYAVSAYILHRANIVEEDMELTHENLAQIKMPNHDNFYPSDRE